MKILEFCLINDETTIIFCKLIFLYIIITYYHKINFHLKMNNHIKNKNTLNIAIIGK